MHSAATTHLHLALDGSADDLTRELETFAPGLVHTFVSPSVLSIDLTGSILRPAYASQVLPDVQPLSGASIGLLARAVFDAIVGLPDAPWRLHVFTHPLESPPVSSRRVALVRVALDELLKKKQRRLLRSRVASDVPRAAETIVQVLLLSAENGFISIASDAAVSPFVAGIPTLVDDQRPPSRAYLKLLEMEAHLGQRIVAGETCVDLGGSPGGWTFVALDRGASCVSVDRSPLREDIMAHSSFSFVKGDAFAFVPKAPVDWLLCDVIAVPERSLEMLTNWIDKKLCRRFCVTLKFKGDADMNILVRARAAFDARPVRYDMRRLAVNKNELSVFGTLS
ncbi:MAG: hypothetical protein H7Z43_05455 [Clostridia bacterium]|nr:hypothetical protein [Deltaproteobacteria bacterium]